MADGRTKRRDAARRLPGSTAGWHAADDAAARYDRPLDAGPCSTKRNTTYDAQALLEQPKFGRSTRRGTARRNAFGERRNSRAHFIMQQKEGSFEVCTADGVSRVALFAMFTDAAAYWSSV